MKTLANLILKIHAVFLMVLTATNTCMSLIGTFHNVGPYAWLHATPLVEAGLYQAYLILFLLAFLLFKQSKNPNPLVYNAIALLVHGVAGSVNFIFRDSIQSGGFDKLSSFSISLHTIWICLELVAIISLYKRKNLLKYQIF